MWFTKNFRAIWWFILIACLSIFMLQRFSDLASGEAKPIDFLLFLVWIGVCLGPLFAEVHLPGLTLKQKIEETKKELTRDIESLRADIRNSVEIRSHVSPNFWVGAGSQPPPDHKLGEVEQRLHSAIDRLERQGYPIDSRATAQAPRMLSEREQIMFTSRRDIEVELRAIAASLDDEPDQRRFAPVSRLLWLLTRNELIDKQMANVIREVYSICSLAIHGEEVTESQVDFVQRNGPELVNALRAIRERDV
ncbi:hypothetical protein [Pseudoxanthomonas koreensis]|uniref:hypothetical protein n=1 Tax=Pseudoxanthomonas koreensis TaxID=266061 RepID=UPI0035A684C0